jgi:hypothetical protein
VRVVVPCVCMTAGLRVLTRFCNIRRKFPHITCVPHIFHCLPCILPAEETPILCYRPDWRTCCAVADEN